MEALEQVWEKAKVVSENVGLENATEDILSAFGLLPQNIKIAQKPNDNPKTLVLTTEGEFGLHATQTIRIPANLFEFPKEMVLHMLAHETYHVRQKTAINPIFDKNEREFEAYYEGVFPKHFAHLPSCPKWLKKQFATQALRYFGMIEPFSVLYFRFLTQKYQLEEYLLTIP
jgi:hypothetical protein